MTRHVKTALTLAFLVALLIFGLAWGWSAMTQPFPKSAPVKACYPTLLQAGDRVSAPKVTVSVFNASRRVGLADRTMSDFQDQGFGAGDVGNAPKKATVRYAQVWSGDRSRPDVRLVASRLGHHILIARKHIRAPGVVVVVGAQFQHLIPGRSSVKVTRTTTICSPPTG
ncbi:MAG: LytR C-terminal domain-containing protein [Nocardioides sp.]|nr:LytR C-terminal domain-containing protein [Nocardioides sp.]